MKKIFLFLFLLPLAISCLNNADPDPVSEVGYPHEWIFTNDEGSIYEQDPSVAEYSYIYTNKYAVFRDDIQQSYPLEDLAVEEHCLFYVSESESSDGKTCYTIQLNSDRIRFLGVGPSSNKEEVHMHMQTGEEIVVIGNPSRIVPPGDNTEDGDYYKFYIHKMPDVKGVRTLAIESVAMPGWYISNSPPGFNYAANVVTLQEVESPDSAPKWQGRDVQ